MRAASAKGAHPLVAAQASWFLAHLEDQRGETAEAASLRASLGLLSHAFVIGPFGEGRASLNAAFPPETEARRARSRRSVSGQDARGRLALGRRGDAGRRPLPGRHAASRGPGCRLRRRVRAQRTRSRGGAAPRVAGADQGLGQRRGRVHARRGPPAVAGSGRGRHPPRAGLEPDPDQDRDQRRGLAVVRACHGRRRDVTGLRDDVGAPPLPRRWRGGRRRPIAPRADTLDALLERRARRLGAAGGRAWVDLARVLAWTTPRDRDDRAASTAFTQAFKLRADGSAVAPPEPALRLAAAEATDDDDERRRMLEQALATRSRRRSGAALLLARLGVIARARRAATRGRWSRGARRWRPIPVLAGGAGARPGGGGRRAAAHRRDPPGGAAARRSGAAARAARGRAPVRRGGPAARGRSRAGRSGAASGGRTPSCCTSCRSARAAAATATRRGRGWRRRRRCGPTCRRWRSSWRA